MEIYLGKLNSSAKKQYFLKDLDYYFPLYLKKNLVRSFDFNNEEHKRLDIYSLLEKLGFDREKFDKGNFYEDNQITIYKKIFSFDE